MSEKMPGIEGIGQISIVVSDVDRATAFYRDVLGLPYLFGFPGMAFFDCGGVRLYLARAETPELDRTSIVYYRVPHIAKAADSLKARGVEFEHEPRAVHKDERHELWLGFFKDSEGNNVALMSEVPVEP
jgi:methylmalonyl-CoA/ethylmalonyl-CoA epimerase